MRVCIVVSKNNLHLLNQMIDQNRVEICAIITEDRTVAINAGCPANITYAFWQIKEVVQQVQPDYILVVVLSFSHKVTSFVVDEMKKINFSHTKICDISSLCLHDGLDCGSGLVHLEQNPDKYKIFVTGSSYSKHAIDENSMNLPTISFAFDSQDIYYGYKVAEKLIPPPPAKNNFKYALVELAPYVLHSDLSKEKIVAGAHATRYFFALNDFHNYWIKPEIFWSFVKNDFIEYIKNVVRTIKFNHHRYSEADTFSTEWAIAAIKEIEIWKDRDYPDTVAENKQVIKNYLSLLDQYKITPILYLPPMVKEYAERFNRKMLNELSTFLNELAHQHKFIFIDTWKIDTFNDHDFHDIRHMNYNGAKKFTKILNDLIDKLEGKN